MPRRRKQKVGKECTPRTSDACSSRELDAELAQMMIAVEPAPAHPIGLAEVPENRMRMKLEVARLVGEACDDADQFRAVELKISGRISVDELIELRPRRNALRPRDGNAKRDPFDECPLHGIKEFTALN